MKLSALVAGVLLFVFAGTPGAMARPNDGSGWVNWGQDYMTGAKPRASKKLYRAERRAERRQYARQYASSRSGLGGRPRAWCGWWMRTQKGGGPEMNLAWNWSRWGSPGSPQVGAVVVWRHHVGMITGRTASGQWIVKSGNDGGRVRERARSIAGAVIRV